MATRRPLHYDANGDLQEFTDADIQGVIDRAVYLYQNNPSISLSVVGSGGNLGSIVEHKFQAGAVSSSRSSIPGSAAGTVRIKTYYSRVEQTISSGLSFPDTGDIRYPVYYTSGGDIRSMSKADFNDTFIEPAIDYMFNTHESLYTVSTSSSKAGFTLVSGTPIYTDQVANVSAYTSGNLPEAINQHTNKTNYYLHRNNGTSAGYELPLYIWNRNNVALREFDQSGFDQILEEGIRFVGSGTSGQRLSFAWNNGTQQGTSITDHEVQGSLNRTQGDILGTDYYYRQKVPNGGQTLVNTHYLGMRRT